MIEFEALLGDYTAFFAQQRERVAKLGIDISDRPISHLAYRTETIEDYVSRRDAIEKFCSANVENVWNGRPISKLRLAESLQLDDQHSTQLIELIPPKHRDAYRMGLEHVGIVYGDDIDAFFTEHQSKLSGQQLQSEACEPYYIRFETDQTMVKFYRHSLQKVCEIEGHVFDSFYHDSEVELP